MSKILNKILAFAILITFQNLAFGQCESNLAETCCSSVDGVAFTTMNVNPSSCLVNISNSAAYIVFNVAEGGGIDALVDGDANSGFFDVAIFNIPPGTTPCDITADDQITCSFAPAAGGCTSWGTAAAGCSSNFPAIPVTSCDRILVLVENFSLASNTFDIVINNTDDNGGHVGPPEADIPDAASCTSAGAFQLNNMSDVAGPNAQDGGVDIPGAIPAETGVDADACPNAGGGTYTATCGACISATGVFDPTVAGAGTHTITYEHYTTADQGTMGNCCYAVDESTILVDADPDPQVTCPAADVCSNAGLVDLAYTDNNAALATNGAPTLAITGSGAAFVDANNMFDPVAAGPGTYTITYTLTSVNGLCEDFITCNITVISCTDCPDIAPAITAQAVCSGGEPDFATAETEVNATGNNQGAYTYFTDAGFATPYAGPLTNMTCMTMDVTIYGRLQCTDPAAAGNADEFEDFSFVVTVYPDPINFVINVTPSTGCSVAPVITNSTCPTISSEGWMTGGPIDGCSTDCPTTNDPVADTYVWVQIPPAFTATAPAGCVYPDDSGSEMVMGCDGVVCQGPCGEIQITDPCTCSDDQSANGAGDGTFTETVTVTANSGLMLEIGAASTLVGTTLNVGDPIPETPAGSGNYELMFTHTDGVGYVVFVVDDMGNDVLDSNLDPLMESNNCVYPVINFAGTAALYCTDEEGIADLGALVSIVSPTGASGTTIVEIDNTAVVGLDPSTLAAGTHTIDITFTGTFINDQWDGTTPAFPGCETTLQATFDIGQTPDAFFDCPSAPVPLCEGNVPLNPVDNNNAVGAVGVWSGTGAVGVVNDELDPLLLVAGPTYTLIYTLTTPEDCVDSFECIFTIVNTCAADGGRFNEDE